MQAHEYVILEISRERERQMAGEGWTHEHDDAHSSGEMAKAAACYALDASRAPEYRDNSFIRSYWPWDWSWWKPRGARKNLIRAAALIVAEIERIDRASIIEKLAKALPKEPAR